MIQRWLLALLIAISCAAYLWPAPFLATKPGLDVMIGVIMFSIGLMLPTSEIRQIGGRWPMVLAGTGLQYAIMPTLAGILGWAAGLQGPLWIGVVMVGCVPGAMASNVLTLNARGNTSYSVCLTTLATILSPLATPFALQLLLSSTVVIPVGQTALRLLLTVVLPVISGYLLQRAFPKLESHARRLGPSVANLVILWVIGVVVALNRTRLGQSSLGIILPLLTLNLAGYAAGYASGWMLRLPEGMRRALTLEIGMQNAGVGALLALRLFDEQSALAPALYTFGCMLTGTLLARLWASRPPDDEDGRGAVARQKPSE